MNAGTILESWERSIQQSSRALQAWLNRNKWVLGGALLLAMGLYYPIFQHGLENLDSFCTAEPYWADLWDRIPYWESVQGRWALRLTDAFSDGMHPYFLTVFMTTAFFLLAALVLCDLLAVQSVWIRFAAASLLTCSQYVMNLQTYRYCSTAYALSFFLAVWAVFWANRTSLGSVLFGALCLTVSLGLYQSSLGVAAVVCLFLLVKTLFGRGVFDAKVRYLLVRLLLMGIIGGGLYLLILQVLLRIYDASLADINGINQVGVGLLPELPHGILQAYRDFGQYFLGREIAQNFYSIRPIHAMLLLGGSAVFVYNLFRCRKKPAVCIVSVLCILLMPAAANVTDIINPTTEIALRMAGGMALVPLFCVALLARGIRAQRSALQKAGVLLLSLVLLRGYMLQSNNDIQVMVADKTQALTLGQEILTQLVEREEYQQGMPVAIIGTPSVAPSTYRDRANPLIQSGIFWGDVENNRDAWIRLMDQELGAQISWCSSEQVFALWGNETFWEMPPFPQEGAIAVIDNVLVVRIA